MFRKIEDFVDEWHHERTDTLRLLRSLTDASLSTRVTDEGRSLGRLAWHVALSVAEILSHAGLPIESLSQEAPVPATASAIADRYELDSAAAEAALRIRWHDSMLDKEVPMYGELWRRGKVLSVLIRHQSHHRGQMTVLMRQAGLPVIGVYGPAREEWSALGMPAMD